MADILVPLALLANTLIICQCTALAVSHMRSAGKKLDNSWLKPAAVFCVNSSFIVIVHLLISVPFYSLFSHSARQVFSSVFHILISVNIYLIPRLIHEAKPYKAHKFTNLLFLACTVFTVGYEFFQRTGIVYFFLAGVLLYLVAFSVSQYFSDQTTIRPFQKSVMMLGLVTLLCFPFLASDIFLDKRTAALAFPIGTTQVIFFPFVLTACSIILLIGITAASKTAQNGRPEAQTDRHSANTFTRRLSLREREIFEYLLTGSRNKDIAQALAISESTVKKHVRNILKKTDSASRLELIRKVESPPIAEAAPEAGTGIEPNVAQITPQGHFQEKSGPSIVRTTSIFEELKNMKKRMKIVVLCTIVLVTGTATALTLYFSDRNKIDFESIDWHTKVLAHAPEEYENEDGFWAVSTPEKEEYFRTAVLAHLEVAIRTGADALLVARGNKIVCEWYSERYKTPFHAMSSTKSIAGLLCGIMADRGLIDIDDPVSEYLPSWVGGFRNQVTIRHLLSMSSGLLKKDSGEGIGYISDKNAYVLGLYPDVEPGTRWSYSNEGVQLLSPLMETAAGTDLNSYADEYLFSPLGMERTSFYTGGGEGAPWTYADMKTSPRDFARIGWLVMNGGIWNGERIVSADYLEEMVAPQPTADFYGLLWWLHEAADLKGYGTQGYLNTDMYIFPREELIVVRMQAPRGQFTGEKESANYQELAWQLFKAFTSTEPARIMQPILKEIEALPSPGQESSEGETEEQPDETDFEENLQIAMIDSRNGKTHEVIRRLQPYLDHGIGKPTERARAELTIIQQYIRLRNTDRAREIYNGISLDAVSLLPAWYQDYYKELKSEFQE